MDALIICAAVFFALVILLFTVCFVCFRMVFYSPKRTPLGEDEYEIPEGDIYEPFRDEMIGWMKEVRKMPHEDFSVKSFDGLTLRGKYYECDPDAPVELIFHGYKGNAERDLCGGVFRCFALGRNALIIDQRASGTSDGSVISFGVNEYKDCLRWVEFAISHFGSDVKLILTGISMGAATVLMASAADLPANVKYVLADCGYSSSKDIIKKVIREMHLPADIVYPFVKLGARIYGKFDLEEYSPREAMENARVPIIFFHGEADAFVPCDMSREMYKKCVSEKMLVTVADAGHGLCYPVDKEKYLDSLRRFNEKILLSV